MIFVKWALLAMEEDQECNHVRLPLDQSDLGLVLQNQDLLAVGFHKAPINKELAQTAAVTSSAQVSLLDGCKLVNNSWNNTDCQSSGK